MLTYKVLPGDSLSKIKKKLGIAASTDDIVKANYKIVKDPNKIQVGWTLKLPETLQEIKAVRNIYESQFAGPEGFAPIIGPGGKEYFPPTARGKEPEMAAPALPKIPEVGKELEKKYREITATMPKEPKPTKELSFQQMLPYLPEAIRETVNKIPFAKAIVAPFGWWQGKVLNPLIKMTGNKIADYISKPLPNFNLSGGDIAMVKKANRYGIIGDAEANAYFERDKRDQLSAYDFIQLQLLRAQVLANETKRLLNK